MLRSPQRPLVHERSTPGAKASWLLERSSNRYDALAFALLLSTSLGLDSGCKQQTQPASQPDSSELCVASKKELPAPSCPPCKEVHERSSAGLTPQKSGELWGYVDSSDHWVIPARWTEVTYFTSYGTAIVSADRSTYIIDRSGQVLATPFFYDNAPDPLQFGFFRIRDPKSGKTGYLSEDGSFKIPPQWDYATPFQNTFACVCDNCLVPNGEYREIGVGHWRMIDREGKVIRDMGRNTAPPDRCSLKVREWSSFEYVR